MSADTAAHALLVADRPWIQADVKLAGPMIVNQEGVHLSLKITTMNVGVSVAQHVDVKVFLIAVPPQHGAIADRRAEVWRRQAEWLETQAPLVGYSVFPKQTADWNGSVSVTMADVEAGWRRDAPQWLQLPLSDRPLPLLVVGMIAYAQSVTPGPSVPSPMRRTNFAYDVLHIAPIGLTARDYQESDLRLVTSPLGLHHAD